MEEMKQAVESKTEAEQKAAFILTKSGVMFIGNELLGDKLSAIMCEAMLYVESHNLACLTIRADNFPFNGDEPCFGMAYADTHSIAINLEHCWHRACVKASKNDVNLSFMGILWVNLLSTIAHEMDHLVIASNDREMYELMRSTEDGNKELEEAANAAAEPLIMGLSKKFDIEIPAAENLGWFAAKIMDLFTNESTRELEWVIKARKDMEAGIIYAEEKEGVEIKSFREFVKIGYDNDGEGWDQPTSAVNLEAHMDTGVVEEFKAEPVEEPKVETVALESDEKPAEDVIIFENAAGTFIGVGEMDEDGEPNVVMPIKVVHAADGYAGDTLCPNADCGKALKPEWNACPHCETVINQAGLDAVHADLAAQAVVDANTEVPLPAPVAEQVAATTAAAATAVPPVKETPTTYTPNSMEPAAMAGCMEAVWKTLYHHMFTKCGWQQNPQTGRFMFTNAAAVLEGVNIQHILAQFGADNFIMEYDTLDAEGKYAAEMCQGMIRGRTTSKQGLPSYTIYLNIGGQRIKRSFIPQNPEKRNAQNAYTPSADQAGQGHMIVWIFKGEVADDAPFNEKCAATVKDNVYEIMS